MVESRLHPRLLTTCPSTCLLERGGSVANITEVGTNPSYELMKALQGSVVAGGGGGDLSFRHGTHCPEKSGVLARKPESGFSVGGGRSGQQLHGPM